MTYDDGVLTVYAMNNSAANGEKPKYTLSVKSQHFFRFDTLGINRYYTALQANQQIEAVVEIPMWHDVSVHDVVMLENGLQYRVQMVQPTFDEDNLRIMKLSLERISEAYVISN